MWQMIVALPRQARPQVDVAVAVAVAVAIEICSRTTTMAVLLLHLRHPQCHQTDQGGHHQNAPHNTQRDTGSTLPF
jgi:hypothetical protein